MELHLLGPICYIGVGILIASIISLYRSRHRHRLDAAKTLENPTMFKGGKHPPSLMRAPFAIIISAAMLVGAAGVYLYKTGSSVKSDKAAAADPCSACRPDEKTIGLDSVLDDGRITWNWSGSCIGAEACGKCRVKPKSCTTDNDTVFALKCACSNQ